MRFARRIAAKLSRDQSTNTNPNVIFSGTPGTLNCVTLSQIMRGDGIGAKLQEGRMQRFWDKKLILESNGQFFKIDKIFLGSGYAGKDKKKKNISSVQVC